jgi:TetR/AcrR family transcriptional regulator, transcriptional repressor for nem operon
MARQREFDTEAVIHQAMLVFWQRGYVATSMADIYAATGLKPGSLYAAFKDKETLFRQAFEHYAAYFRATLPTDQEGIAAIEAWLALQARLAVEDPHRAGCLIVNTVTERDVHAQATRALSQGRLQEIRDFFVRQLGIAVRKGELADDAPLAMHADALLGAVMSIMTLGRAGADRSTIDNIACSALGALRCKK